MSNADKAISRTLLALGLGAYLFAIINLGSHLAEIASDIGNGAVLVSIWIMVHSIAIRPPNTNPEPEEPNAEKFP